mgnify:CR=1 FL=1
MNVLHNSKCSVEYDAGKKSIDGRDLTDHYNEPAFYSKSKRGLKLAWADMIAKFTPQTTMHDLLVICQEHGIRCHYWCMVD